jgi:membrane associated rhomboid family serine protease
MTAMTADSSPRPIWARPEAFAEADAGWGWVDRKGNRTPCKDLEDLRQSIISDAGARVDLVWTPQSPNLVLPEELPDLLPALKEARVRWAQWEIEEGRRQMLVFGVFLVGLFIYSLIAGHPLMVFGPLGLGLLLFLILGFIPWYQGTKRYKRAKQVIASELEPDIEGLRFETWLLHQKAPCTRALFGLMAVVGFVQLVAPGGVASDVSAAGLTKVNGAAADWWRLATGPFLHGHWLHFLMNASALVYLGRRVELLARWPHMVLVFVVSAWVGGEASARFLSAPSIGASGGILGLLGFLMVFESMHRALVPESVRRRLLAGLLMTAAIGMLGYKLIDNWAHGGGLLAGMLYAVIVFPRSSSAERPKQTMGDRLAGQAGMAICAAAAGWTVWRLVVTGWSM